MRFYKIEVFPIGGSTPVLTYQSHPQGVFNPAALDIEFDLPVATAAEAIGGQTITVHGISLADISQAKQFGAQPGEGASYNLVMHGGMQAGLPLNNPAQAGVVVKGQIFQSYANWIGTDMTLDFVLYPPIFTLDNPGNLVLNWKAGTSLEDALRNTLTTAYPSTPLDIQIGSNYIPPVDRIHMDGTLDGLADFVSRITASHYKSPVSIVYQGGKILVFDKTYQPKTTQLVFTDLIGQPTWIENNTMQIKTVMRADLQLGSVIKMPQGIQSVPAFVTTTSASLPSSMKYQRQR